MWSVATGNSQGLSDQKPSHHGSSSSLASSACSIQSGCTEKAVDNVSIKDSILDGRYMITFIMLNAACFDCGLFLFGIWWYIPSTANTWHQQHDCMQHLLWRGLSNTLMCHVLASRTHTSWCLHLWDAFYLHISYCPRLSVNMLIIVIDSCCFVLWMVWMLSAKAFGIIVIFIHHKIW